MENITTFDLLASFLWTWVVGLSPAILIRFVFLKRPLRKRFVIPLVIMLWLAQSYISFLISDAAEVEWRLSSALVLVALASFFILRKKNKLQTNN
ncbi:MAG: hypothetical protein A3D24_02265 [Candidatus Blackburnbacteria bacterium RIFCSPHIGHO2_02_FULL_39_13]|uniref:Uncharacterized protein n=1 Tax=Candidatus Blackburnbacteria bacterium RIFCSPLOWO2_01_FULL_40_20 TaxID=1797519 RepID=A0A1G1VB54_9BACT|nr:MAG: hypothetical protein A2694_02915 [Candidatus Blackburnbacteria bacterium RIFCSPHIGHO2_01_FULL_40_17]OGY09507.1 MAG: hypothetical protein A3D24_02265 [Candidatus Blackburnbacteria bacterium RIFCSPHIGHO2_02_FULL_39_13]OGY12521.1 MAG: hypothetical protein A3A77_00935 [Candidatus Blackburnbacteria bacterium RIFCSPLOWO2_01_FULL_40_20]OGY15128.1 MAG: hypothetical protein A3I52_00050 [Candidatus Blackburnbacteria bacterium RIFCSPLOWO2_02_FULL_40_10]HBL51665.1 hypothetical protein [Candidatus B